MATLTRYLVRFKESAGIYNAGEEAALSVDDYRRELGRKPVPLIVLLETITDELDGEGKPIAGRQTRVPAPEQPDPPPVAAKDAEIAKLRAQLQAAQERSVLGSDPEKAKLQRAVDELGAQKDELEKKLAQALEAVDDVTAKAKAAAAAGGATIADLQSKLDAAEKKLAEGAKKKA